MQTIHVQLTSLGEDSRSLWLPAGATLGAAMQFASVDVAGRRAAVNGRRAGTGTVLEDQDQVTLVPNVVGG